MDWFDAIYLVTMHQINYVFMLGQEYSFLAIANLYSKKIGKRAEILQNDLGLKMSSSRSNQGRGGVRYDQVVDIGNNKELIGVRMKSQPWSEKDQIFLEPNIMNHTKLSGLG